MYDYIIVGQGIAGSVLSYTLLKKGKKILVVDKGHEPSSSWVAAGLFNPVTGKRMFKTWKAEQIFPFLHTFYKRLETELGKKLIYEKPVYKPFSSIEEQNFWISSDISSDDSLVNPDITNEKYSSYISNNFGGFETRNSGYVDLKVMLPAVKEYLKKNNVYHQDVLNPDELIVRDDKVQWREMEARKIIFCEGYHATQNPFFRWLPFAPVKGEILTVKIKDFIQDSILNKKVFVLPLGNDLYKVGATFDWVLDTENTEKGREELAGKLKELVKVSFEIIGQEAGIRPAVKDRRPLIGIHPEFRSVAIFNGLGTKGISLAPYFAEAFYHYLENTRELEPAANIERFYSLYYHSKD